MKRCQLGDVVVVLQSAHPENIGAFGTIIAEQFAGRILRLPNGEEFEADKNAWVVQARAAEGFVCTRQEYVFGILVRQETVRYPYAAWADHELWPIRGLRAAASVEREVAA